MKHRIFLILGVAVLFFSSCEKSETSQVTVARGANCLINTSDANLAIFGFNTTALGDYDAYVAKLSQDGSVQWTKTFGTRQTDAFYNGKQAADGNFVACGYAIQNDGATSHALVYKISEHGEAMWSKTFHESDQNQFYCMETVGDSGYIACGYNKAKTSANRRLYIVRMDLEGNALWSKTVKTKASIGNDFDAAYWVLTDTDGGFLICGALAEPSSSQYGFLMKLSPQGDSLWTKRFEGLAFSIDRAPDGGLILGGQKKVNSNQNLYMAKYSATYDMEWEHTYESSYYGYGTKVVACQDGSYALTGICLASQSLNYDAPIVLVDATGTQKWFKVFGGSKMDQSFGMVQSPDGNLCTAGMSLSSGSSTILLDKVSQSDGSLIWQKELK